MPPPFLSSVSTDLRSCRECVSQGIKLPETKHRSDLSLVVLEHRLEGNDHICWTTLAFTPTIRTYSEPASPKAKHTHTNTLYTWDQTSTFFPSLLWCLPSYLSLKRREQKMRGREKGSHFITSTCIRHHLQGFVHHSLPLLPTLCHLPVCARPRKTPPRRSLYSFFLCLRGLNDIPGRGDELSDWVKCVTVFVLSFDVY